ncbi:hypothetical protein [Algoriphagus chordae]|uniref:Uncharacterized protein n=1 Tax=Algoriphagus chordae TaxID=237019 RepID=A0A2W7QYR3_9BACT|nr:hypothetical protein [Algoriphagus chordae]PZX46919.1 hypothetical protein LV85_04143 [Algoriphagus chordae]
MKQIKGLSFGILFLAIFGLFSCAGESSNKLEELPYFDLKGFIEMKIQEIDSVNVIKVSRIQGEEKKATVVYSTKDWEEEFSVFTDADINKTSLIDSYDTEVSNATLKHELFPTATGNVKYIKITYFEDQVSSISIKMADENLFYNSTTLAEIYMNNATKLIDHYSIETTQKIWFMDANNMRIQGAIKP